MTQKSTHDPKKNHCYQELEQSLGYVFKDKNNLILALRHKSLFPHETPSSFERLEFLGDRVLGLAVSDLLYKRYRGEDEHALSLRLAELVNHKSLLKIAKHLHLRNHLMADHKDPNRFTSKILSDSVEAVIGALFLENGFKNTQILIERLWKPFLDAQIMPCENYKSRLQHLSQQHYQTLPHYTLVSQHGPSHQPYMRVKVAIPGLVLPLAAQSFEGAGASKKEAEQQAAQKLLTFLKNQKQKP